MAENINIPFPNLIPKIAWIVLFGITAFETGINLTQFHKVPLYSF